MSARAIAVGGVPERVVIEDLKELDGYRNPAGHQKTVVRRACCLCRTRLSTLVVVYRNGAGIELCEGCWTHRISDSAKQKVINVVQL